MGGMDAEVAASVVDEEREAATGGGVRWWVAVGAGVVISVPLGWLLSYGASLPFMLGLFFFALFGLVVGAVVFRVGVAARPIPTTHIKVGTAVVIIACWGLSLGKEVNDFPLDMADYVIRAVQLLPDGMTSDDLQKDVVEFVGRTLRERYGGDGVLAYSRWALTSSRMEYNVATMTNPIILSPAQHRWWWGFRVLSCAALLTFGIYSQTSLLADASDPQRAARLPAVE